MIPPQPHALRIIGSIAITVGAFLLLLRLSLGDSYPPVALVLGWVLIPTGLLLRIEGAILQVATRLQPPAPATTDQSPTSLAEPPTG